MRGFYDWRIIHDMSACEAGITSTYYLLCFFYPYIDPEAALLQEIEEGLISKEGWGTSKSPVLQGGAGLAAIL